MKTNAEMRNFMNKKEIRKKLSAYFFYLLIITIFFVTITMLSLLSPDSDSNTSFFSTKAAEPSDTTSMPFVYNGDNYRYSMTENKKEVLSFRCSDGSYTDILNGVGNYKIYDTSGKVIGDFSQITSFEVLSSKQVLVSYQTDAGKATTLYTFYKDHVEVIASLDNFYSVSNIGNSYFERNFLLEYKDCEKRVSSQWIYPENNDFPYRDFESTVTIHQFDNQKKLYTFLYGDNAEPKEPFIYYPEVNLPLYIDDSLSSYQLAFSLVFEDLTLDTDHDYLALFKSKDAEIACKISAATDNGNNSTIFTDKDLTFNINLTSLSESEVPYTLSYKIYDYYGNIYEEKEISQSLSSFASFDYNLNFHGQKYGIYYLDIKVQNAQGIYRELYPFGILSNYTYTHQTASPFGISGIRFGEYEPNEDTISLFSILGIANARVCISTPDYLEEDYTLLKTYLEKLHQQGVGLTGQYLLDNWVIPEDSAQYSQSLSEILSYIAPYLENCEIGNENNNTDKTLQDAMNYYIQKQFLPTFDIVTKQYQLPIMSSGVFLSKTDWLELSLSSGLWEVTDSLSTHAYSFPHSPDYTADPSTEHSFESALVRIRNFLNIYGDKKWYLSEIGLPTTPESAVGMFSGVDLRTQADYTIREFLLGLSYGADVIEVFSMYDQKNILKDYSSQDCEYHFGMFYDKDYYGRIFPKPLSLAFGNMTRTLDSIISCQEIESNSKTLRIFSLKTDKIDSLSSLTAIWSNCSPLTNDCVDAYRTPNLPWNNQWENEEIVSFSTAASSVTVIDIMGNETIYYADDGIVNIPVTGSPIFIKGSLSIIKN